MAGDMIKVGGLWANKDKNGKTFLTGKLSPTVKIVIFQNQYRESENQPTHILYLAPVESEGSNLRQQGQRQGDEADEFFDEQSFQRGQARASELRQARAAQGGHVAPEDVPPSPADEYRPAPRQVRPAHRQPAPPPDYDQDDLEDPFADDAPAVAPTRQPQRPGTGRSAGF